MILSSTKELRVLVLAPHTDDGEFGCGATIAKLVEQEIPVHYAAFSVCEQSVPRHLPRDVLAHELKQACEILGIPVERQHVYQYPVRLFPQYRQELLEELLNLKTQVNPNLILLPSTSDTHQDHQAICNEGFRAFKDQSILGYEMPWNNISFTTTCFNIISTKHVERKVQAMKAYQSQDVRPYADRDFVFSLARTRGVQVRSQYAEAFEVIRIVT